MSDASLPCPGTRHDRCSARADSYPLLGAPENRLTEIFAEVLRSVPALGEWLVAEGARRLGDDRPPPVSDRYDVTSQVSFYGGAIRPDLEITPAGHPTHKMFVENKLTAAWTMAQHGGYPERTVGIVPWERRDDPRAPFAPLTWTDVAGQGHRIGRSWSGPDWRDHALPDTPSQYRLLHELLTYLERKVGVVVPRPLDDSDVSLYAGAEASLARWSVLLDTIADGLRTDPGVAKGPEKWQSDLQTPPHVVGRMLGLDVDQAWPALSQSLDEQGRADVWLGFELVLAPQVSWLPELDPRPGLGVGLTLAVAPDWPPGLGEGGRFADAAERAGFRRGTTARGRVGRFFRTRFLEDLVAEADTLDAQATTVVAWVRQARDDLQALTPSVR